MTNTTERPTGWSGGTACRLAGAVTDVAQRSLPHPRRDTPTPGWESGVWVRIQRRRRTRRLGLLVLTILAAGLGFLAARRPAPTPTARVRIGATLDRPLRADGSAPLGSVWRIRFE